MRFSRQFIAAFVAGIVVTVLGAGLLPNAEHLRYRSLIEVQPNGGRLENFVVRWPEDRLPVPGETPGADNGRLAGGSDEWRASVELFRLRDGAGNVIGVASRTASRSIGESRSGTDWLLVVPARGSLVLSQRDAVDTTLREAAGADPVSLHDDPASWSAGRRERRISAGPSARDLGRILRGTGEFRGLAGTYTEDWRIDSDATRPAGEIVLATRLIGRSE